MRRRQVDTPWEMLTVGWLRESQAMPAQIYRFLEAHPEGCSALEVEKQLRMDLRRAWRILSDLRKHGFMRSMKQKRIGSRGQARMRLFASHPDPAELARQGHTRNQIAAIIGCHPASVLRFVQRAGYEGDIARDVPAVDPEHYLDSVLVEMESIDPAAVIAALQGQDEARLRSMRTQCHRTRARLWRILSACNRVLRAEEKRGTHDQVATS